MQDEISRASAHGNKFAEEMVVQNMWRDIRYDSLSMQQIRQIMFLIQRAYTLGYADGKTSRFERLTPARSVIDPAPNQEDRPTFCGFCAGDDPNYESQPQRWISGYWFHSPKVSSKLYGAASCLAMNK